MPIFPPYLVPYSELVTPSDTSSLVCQCPESVAETIAEDVARGPYSYCLERLDYDILEVIYEYLRPAFGLRPLALTCKWLRESCKPVLFRRSLVRADLVTKEHFLPSHLGIYVHSLTFVGGWKYPTPPCPRYRPASLSELFTRTPHLSRVNIKVTRSSGVPWLAIDEILTLPRLRIFDIDNTLNYHTRRPDDLSHQVLTSISAPLTTYRQSLEDYRPPPRRLPSDADAIACVIGQKQVQQSLEYLTLPSEIAPLAALEAAHWPKLKTVSLRGELKSTKNVMCAFEQMPALEELCLSVARPAGTDRALVFCSLEWHGSFPWPRLKRLVVSYPDPDDKLYSLLSIADTLQCLDLRCWPRHYIHLSPDDRMHMRQLRWRSPILTSSELLRLFGRCHSRHLTELAIEYLEDEDDLELLKNIPISFPNLRTLIFYRYRRLRTDNVPIRAIGEALASHPRLRVIYAHLDLSGTPQPWVNCYHRDANDRLARHRQVLVDAARELAQGLGTSVQAVCLLYRVMQCNIWRPFCIVRGGNGIDVSSNAAHADVLGLVNEDEPGPPHEYREWAGDN